MKIFFLYNFLFLLFYSIPLCGNNQEYKLIWEDSFTNPQTLKKNWEITNASEKSILSSRWKENIKIRKGLLCIENRRENKGGKNWTSGKIQSKKFFTYGYIESKIKISQASGINNAFWLQNKFYPQKQKTEIDIAEIHFPNKIQISIHDWGNGKSKVHKQKSFSYKATQNLSEDFHIYGFEWDADSVFFYFDKKLIYKEKNEICHDPVRILFSTAVMNWAGTVTEKINGTIMSIDYVKVYQRI